MTSDDELIGLARRISGDMVGWRRHLHAHPETAFEEHATTRFVADELERLGCRVRRNINRTGVLAEIRVPGAVRTVACRADIDALPVADRKTADYRSRVPRAGHLCGHDAHTAMVIGAAHLLTWMRHRLRVNVKLFFQPSEELPPGGARGIVESGLVDDVSEILALHVYSGLATGRVGVCAGPFLAGIDRFVIRLAGRGGPEGSHAACTAGAEVVTALQSIVARNVDPLSAGVISVCRWRTGPDDGLGAGAVELLGSLRFLREPVRAVLHRRIEALAAGLASAHGLTAEIDIDRGYPPTVNSGPTIDRVRDCVKRIFGSDERVVAAQPRCGSEDFAYFLQRCPGAIVWLGTGNPQRASHYPHHHPLFDIDEDALPVGAALLADFCLSQDR